MAATAAEYITKKHDFTTCPICLDVINNPKSLPCIHGFCLKCLEQHFKDRSPGDEVNCPLCSNEFKIPTDGLVALRHHFFIQHLVDAKNAAGTSEDKVLCEVCSEDNEEKEGDIPLATLYCVDCNEKLCERCSKPHRKMKRGAHQVRALGTEVEKEVLQFRESLCGQHPEKQVKLYCYECSENICLMCSAFAHKQHNTVEIPEAAKTFLHQIDSDDDHISNQTKNIREKSQAKDKQRKEFISEVDRLKGQLTQTATQIREVVDKQVAMWTNELDLVKAEDTKKAETVEDRYQLALVARESFHAYSRVLLDKGRPSDITRAGDELHKRATELLADDVTSAQYSPTEVFFRPVDVGQLAVINLIGQVATGNAQASGLARRFVPIDCQLERVAETEKQLRQHVSQLQEETRQAVQKENKTLENNIRLEAQIKESMEKQSALADQLKQVQSELVQIQTNEKQLQMQLKEKSDSEQSLRTKLTQLELSERRLDAQLRDKTDIEGKLQHHFNELLQSDSQLQLQLKQKSENEMSLSSQLKVKSDHEEALKLQLKQCQEKAEQLQAQLDTLLQTETRLNDKVSELSDKEAEMKRQLEKLSKSEQESKTRLKEECERRSDLQKKNLELTELDMKQRHMGHVVHTLPEGLSVYGVTSLDNLIYVLRDKSAEQLEVYDQESYRLLRSINIPGLGSKDDLTACKHNRCLYLSDASNKCVHRVALAQGLGMTQWSVNDKPARLSVTDTHCVLVTCDEARRIKQFSTDGRLIRVLSIPYVASPWHTVQLPNGQFVVCHGGPNDQEHRVCLLAGDGHVVKSYGGSKGSGYQLDGPAHLAVDTNGFVYVIDLNNRRVLLLSPALSYVREAVSRDQLKTVEPQRMHLDDSRRHLVVGYRTSSFDVFRSNAEVKRTGRVAIISI